MKSNPTLSINTDTHEECAKLPLLALTILFFFAAFFPINALAMTAHLTNNAPEFIESIEDSYGAMINSAALLHDADLKLVLAVIVVESEGNARAVSNKGAQGLMQLMPKTARAMGAKDPKEPLQNILAGTRYLKELEDHYGFSSPEEILVAYNMGPTRAKRWLAKHSPEEHAYVANVLYVYNILLEKEKTEAIAAENAAKKLAQEDILFMLRPLMVEPRTLSLLDLPMTISSLRRDKTVFEN